MLIKQEGTYRGAITAHGVNATNNGLPQWSVGVIALEKYDYDMKQWVDWSACQDNALTGYLVLFSKEGKPTFHIADIMASVEWDGGSLAVLNAMDLENAGIQFNVEEHIYNEQTSMKLTKVQPYDATPSIGGVRKISEEDAKKLDAQFAAQLRKISGGPKPVSAPPAGTVTQNGQPAPSTKKPVTKVNKPKAPAAPTAPTAPTAPAPDLFDNKVEDDDPKPETPAAPTVPSVPAAPKVSAPPSVTADAPSAMTKEEAWEESMSHKGPHSTDDDVVKSWQKSVKQIMDAQGYASDDDLSPEDWAAVCTNVINETGIPF